MSKLSIDQFNVFSSHTVPISAQLVQGNTPEYPPHFSQLPQGIRPVFPPSTFIRADAPAPVCTYVEEPIKKRVIPMKKSEEEIMNNTKPNKSPERSKPPIFLGSQPKSDSPGIKKSSGGSSSRLSISGKINRQKKVSNNNYNEKV